MMNVKGDYIRNMEKPCSADSSNARPKHVLFKTLCRWRQKLHIAKFNLKLIKEKMKVIANDSYFYSCLNAAPKK